MEDGAGVILCVLGECTRRQVLSAPPGNPLKHPSKSPTNCQWLWGHTKCVSL